MKKIIGSNNIKRHVKNPIVALGNFDGVHLGHRKLVQTAMRLAAKTSGTAVVYTFDPHPARILSAKRSPSLLQTLEQRLASLEELGVDACIVEPFTAEFAHMGPKEFFGTVIIKRLGARRLVAGYDFTFGLHRHGTAEMLKELGASSGVEVTIIEAQFVGETLVSSTNIRHLLAKGNVAQAARLLGRPYSIEGKVVRGRGIGDSLNAKTANIEPSNELIPQDGVYITRTRVAGKDIPSITSIGTSPTFPEAAYSIETHMIGVEMDVQGRKITVEFLERERDQVAFDTVEKLREQIALDIQKARKYHQSR